MNNDKETKDDDFLYELDIDHIDQAQVIKPSIVSPENNNAQPQPETTYSQLNQQNIQTNEQVKQPIQSTSTASPINIDKEYTQAATAIVNKDLLSNNTQIMPQQVQTAPTMANNGLYSSDPQTVNTDIARDPQLQPNIYTANHNQSVNTQQFINKPIYGGIINPSQTSDNITIKPPIKKRPFYKNKKIILIIAGSILVLLIILGAIFGLYLPNTPNNVWNTGLNRTGIQTAAVIEALSDPKVSETLKKSKIEAGGTVNYGEQNYSVSSNVSIDASKSDTTAQIKASSGSAEDLVVDVALKTYLPEAALLPNLYLKLGLNNTSILSSFGIPEKYNNVWISAEQDIMNELAKSYNVEQNDSNNVTKEDIISVVNDFNSVSQQYVFTSNPQYSIINKKSYIGSEDINGVKTNHYKAGVNKDNAKQYCYAVFDKLMNNATYKKYVLSGDTNIDARKQENNKECDRLINDIPDNFEFDIWINKSIKIIQQIRIYEDLSKQAEEAKKRKTECLQTFDAYNGSSCDYADDLVEKGQKYTEFGQIIKSKKELSLYTSDVSDTDKNKSNIRAEIYVNSETYELNGKITAKADNPDNKINVDLTFKMLPYQGEIDTTKPKDAVPIQQVLEESNL